jgi:hypothetical protein
MSPGLPLANPTQARLLVKGYVWQCFANWQGLEQNVVLEIIPTPPQPLNLTLNWPAGMLLATAIQNTFTTALPSAQFEIGLSPRLVLNHDELGIYGSIEELSTFLNSISRRIITDAGYPGVTVTYDGATLRAFDLPNSSNELAKSPPIHIDFKDLIGQPSWIRPRVISAKMVMRGDLEIGGEVVLPRTLVTTTTTAQTNLVGNPANNLNFGGDKYIVTSLHHYGNFRQADSSAWCSVIEMTKPP